MPCSIVYDGSASPEIEGGQKQIFKGEYHEGGEVKPCAVARPTFGYAKGMAEEVALWQEVCCPGHDNILRLFHFSEKDCLIAMELIHPIGYDLVALGTLYSYDNKMMPIAESADVFRKLVSALRYMHQEKDVIHRDLKADQVLIAGSQEVKLTDFGLAVTVASLKANAELRPMPRSAPSNIAPEIPQMGSRNPEMYDGMVDLFGLGWILSQLYSDLLPRRGSRLSEVVLRNECGNDKEARETLQDLVETRAKLIVADPGRRMTLDELEARKWMKTEKGDDWLAPNLLGDTSDTSSQRLVLRKFRERLVAVCAVLQSPFPRSGMLLKDVHSSDWTCLLIENPSGEYDTFPSADTKLELRQRIFFGCKPNASVELTCASEADVEAVIASLDDESHLSKDLTVGGTEVLAGSILRNSTDVKVGAALVFDYDPKLRLSRMLQLDFSDDKARQEAYHALSPFSLEFDAFEFPESLVSPAAVLGSESFKTDDSQVALDFRSKYAVNLAGIARPTDGKLKVEWMPGPRSLLCPGSLGLVVRKPTKSGITLPTITCEKLVEMGLARSSKS